MLSMFVNENMDDWDGYLPYSMMAYWASVQEITRCTPNHLITGCTSFSWTCESLPNNVMYGSYPDDHVQWVRQATENAFEFARDKLHESAVRQERL